MRWAYEIGRGSSAHNPTCNDHYIPSEDLLRALLETGDELTIRALHTLGVRRAALDEAPDRAFDDRVGTPVTGVDFGPQAKQVLDWARLSAQRSFGDGRVGCEHLLVVLFRRGSGIYERIPTLRGLNEAAVRGELNRARIRR